MQFDSISAFIDMGGYGFFVWLSYGFAFATLGILLNNTLMKEQSVRKQIAQKHKREQKLRQAAQQQQGGFRLIVNSHRIAPGFRFPGHIMHLRQRCLRGPLALRHAFHGIVLNLGTDCALWSE